MNRYTSIPPVNAKKVTVKTAVSINLFRFIKPRKITGANNKGIILVRKPSPREIAERKE